MSIAQSSYLSITMDSKDRFSNRVNDYVKYRPGYPAEIIGFLQNDYGLYSDRKIADIGAGTGMSSKLFLVARYDVVAVEPNKEMREKAVELLNAFSGFTILDGSAEHTGLGDASIDAIICGQAFHWFDVPKTKEEFKRIVKDDGIVVLIWNERKMASGFEKEYDSLIVKHATDYVKVDHRNIDLAHIEAFFSPNPCRLEIFQNSQVFDFDGLVGRLASSSYMPARIEPGYAEMITDLKELFFRYQAEGKITIHYDTKVYVGKL
ncbi:MAG: class I SAM-dependent methyltransferase [Flavipsychrobacter sp.]|nr:class I SAM-dependent methyltransferase [Flavipsychrobacter sp.]